MKELDEILYDALLADQDLMDATEGRIESTCFEVSPDQEDNTQLPCIIVTDDELQNSDNTKDTCWESEEDRVQASVEIDGKSPREVKRLRRMVRRAVASHIRTLADNDEEKPSLQFVQCNGIAWDWMKPCYHTTITYVCYINNHLNDDEQEDNE